MSEKAADFLLQVSNLSSKNRTLVDPRRTELYSQSVKNCRTPSRIIALTGNRSAMGTEPEGRTQTEHSARNHITANFCTSAQARWDTGLERWLYNKDLGTNTKTTENPKVKSRTPKCVVLLSGIWILHLPLGLSQTLTEVTAMEHSKERGIQHLQIVAICCSILIPHTAPSAYRDISQGSQKAFSLV